MKKMFDLMMQKKWLLLVLAIVVVAALVVGIVALTGGGEKDPNPTEGTSNVGVTDPTGTTGGNGDNTDPTDPEAPDVTDPTDPEVPDVTGPTDPEVPDVTGSTDPDAPDVTDPTDPDAPDVTDPTGTPENPAKPDDPQKPDDYTEPSEPDVTVPEPTSPELDPDDAPSVSPDIGGDDDEDDKDLETPPVTPPTPDIDVDDEMFGGVTGATIRYSDWESWDHKTRQAFLNAYAYCEDPEVMHNILLATALKDYDCGVEGHACKGEASHNNLMEMIAEGCPYCGKNDCPSFFALDAALFTEYDPYACPEYDKHKDPTEYCQECGLPNYGESGDVICHKYVVDTNCTDCGEPVKAMECHECIVP